MQRQARHGTAIDLEDKEVLNLPLDLSARAAQQFIVLDPRLNQGIDGTGVLFLGLADRLVLIGMHQGADALVGEDFREQAFLHPAIDNVYARHTVAGSADGLLKLRERFRGHFLAPLLEDGVRLLDGQLPQQLAAAIDARMDGDVDELDRVQGLGHLDGHGVGIQPVRMPFAVAAERRNDRDHVMVEQGLQQGNVHALDAAGELVIDALQDAGRMGDQGIAVSPAQIVGG